MARKPVTKVAKAAEKAARPHSAVSGPQFDRLMKPLKPSRSLGLAVSGGGDSVALMLLVSLWRDWLVSKGRPVPDVTVLTVDHGLRKEAAREAQQVARWAKTLGLAHKTFKWKPGHLTSNVQQAARDARYGLLTDWAAQSDADLVVAHHLDDQAETFLMRLQRGSGVDGLAAMAPTSMRAGVRVLRPLLDVPRDALRATLAAHEQAWIDDPSNEDERFLRVQVRKALPGLADLGLSRERLVETAAQMARARAALEVACDQAERVSVTWHDEGFARLLLPPFRALPDEIALRLLVRLLKGVTGSVYGPRLQALEGLRDALCQQTLGGGRTLARTLGGAKWMAVDGSGEKPDEVLVMREVAALSLEPLSLKAGANALW
ncbi:MAG: tRNA lysidine(34) synthetase TilS, partial [Parvibaculum sp.]